jgi:hypothetical protein
MADSHPREQIDWSVNRLAASICAAASAGEVATRAVK